MPKLSEYELEREANIARNRALLEQLDIAQAVEALGIPKKSKPPPKEKAKPVQSAKRVKRERSEVEAPRRQSARLRKEVVDPNESPAQRRKREAELEEQRAREAEARLDEEEKARAAKRPRHHELEIPELLEPDDLDQLPNLRKSLQVITQASQPKRVGDIGAFVFDDKKDTAAVDELREKLSSLKVVSRAKVTQDRIYSAAYHPEISKDLIFFGDKHGQLGIWDAQAPADEAADEDGDVSAAEGTEGGKYWRLQLHWPATSKSSISSVKFDPIDSHNVYTSSYDCTIRSLSFTAGVSREVFSTDEALISSVDLSPNGHQMWISDSLGGVTHLDLREDRSKARWYGLSDQKIGCISVNPTNPNFLLTASNNRLLKIWDTRKLLDMTAEMSDDLSIPPPLSIGGSPRETDSQPTSVELSSQSIDAFVTSSKGKGCLRAEWRHDKSVSSAYWDPRGRSIISTSYDDTLRLWEFDAAKFKSSSPFPTSRPFSRINHNCQTGKWLTVLRAQWSPNPDFYPHFTIGNMNHSLDIFSGKGDVIARLADNKRITAVQAVTCSHPNILERASSGNGSGRCVLWAPSD